MGGSLNSIRVRRGPHHKEIITSVVTRQGFVDGGLSGRRGRTSLFPSLLLPLPILVHPVPSESGGEGPTTTFGRNRKSNRRPPWVYLVYLLTTYKASYLSSKVEWRKTSDRKQHCHWWTKKVRLSRSSLQPCNSTRAPKGNGRKQNEHIIWSHIRLLTSPRGPERGEVRGRRVGGESK